MTRPSPHSFAASDATREAILLRATYVGPTGSGKTLSALKLALRMSERMGLGPVFVVDSENRSALRYAYSAKTGKGYRFKHVPMPSDDYSPQSYMAAVDYCESQGAGVILVDSLSHAWNGVNGVLEQVDEITKRSRSKNSFSEGWGEMTPVQNRLIQHLLSVGCHIIWTMRSKTHYDVGKSDGGKATVTKVGMAPVQREGVDYEPDVSFEMEPGGVLYVGKSRALDVRGLAPGDHHPQPGDDFADIVIGWLEEADAPVPRAPDQPKPQRDAPPPAPIVSAEVIAERARWRKDGGDSTTESVLAASPDPNDRAPVYRWWIDRAKTMVDLDGLVRAVEADPLPLLRSDMLEMIENRRAEMGKTGGGV